MRKASRPRRPRKYVPSANRRERVAPPRFRILPLTMVMAVLLLGVKLGELYKGGRELQEVLQVSSAYAEEEVPAKAGEEAKPEEDDEAAAQEKPMEEAETAEQSEDVADNASEVEVASLDEPKNAPAVATKEGDAEPQRHFSQIELDILQSLAERRNELEERAGKLDLKEKLLEATELRINDKLNEMKSLQSEVQELLNAYNDQEDKKLDGLVKIYENMKAKSAAKIFNELEMGIMLEVADRMSSRKVAPILAAMDPMRAKELTAELAEYRKLKAIPKTLGTN